MKSQNEHQPTVIPFGTRVGLKSLAYFILLWAAGPLGAEPLTLPADKRPAWLARDGIVMAGSWEPLLFRVRRDGGDDYTPSAAQRAAYHREHSPEMVARLKSLGVNFVMLHCYKGAGLEAERESMEDAVRFAKLCHDSGLRVGVYTFSGAFLWEPFFKEVPAAEAWVIRDRHGNRRAYGNADYRYFWNRNHPDAAAFYRQIVRFAVDEIRTDLVHFDNYTVGPGYDDYSVARFRAYLQANFSAAERRAMGIDNLDQLRPPAGGEQNLLRYAWDEFRCRALADSYHDLCRYARSLRPDILVECNPGGPSVRIRPPVDHGRLLQSGEAFWDEGSPSGWSDDGKLRSRIRTYKIARRMDNMAFCYSTTPLEMAESMAFNRDCLGAICWFEYDKITRRPGSAEPVAADLKPFIRFFHERRALLRDAEVVADVAVLRSFPSQAFAPAQHGQLTAAVEQALIDSRVPFQILYDHQLDQLAEYRTLILAGCVALGDAQIEQVRSYVQSGGRLTVIGPAATHDRRMQPRPTAGLADLPATRLADTGDAHACVEAIRQACGGRFSLGVEAPRGLCAELTDQPGRRLLHLVNYRQPMQNVVASVRLPAARRAGAVTLASPGRAADLPVAFRQEDGVVTFTVPAIARYEIAVVTLD